MKNEDSFNEESFKIELEQFLEKQLEACRASGISDSLLIETLRAMSRPKANHDPLLTGIWYLTLEQFVIKHNLVKWADSDLDDCEGGECSGACHGGCGHTT